MLRIDDLKFLSSVDRRMPNGLLLKNILLIISLFSMQIVGISQLNERNNYLQLGKPCPDFTLDQVEYFPQKKVSLLDFEGRWLILEFWSKNCVACVAGFPKINQLQLAFKDRIQIVLIGKNDNKYNKNIRGMYEKYREKENLELTVAYDSLLFDRFDIQSTPQAIIIDPQSIVRAISTSAELNMENLGSLLESKGSKNGSISNSLKSEGKRNTLYWPFIYQDENKDTSILYRSFLSKWSRGQRIAISTIIDQQPHLSGFRATCMSLKRLYTIAYLGRSDWGFDDSLYARFWREPIIETKDSSLFQDDFRGSKGLYNYSLKVPVEKANKEHLKWAMQWDLKKYFGYDVSIETRTMPYWKLIVLDQKLLDQDKSKCNRKERTGDHAGIELKNVSINELLAVIYSYHQLEAPFVNESGIEYNIDINVDALMVNLEDIRKSLQKNGLDLVKSQRKMQVIVIRNPETNSYFD